MEIHPILYNILIDPLLHSSRRRILQHIENGQKVIDIGSGTGELVKEISQKTNQVTGIDLEESMIKFAVKRVNGSMSKGIRFEMIDVREMRQFPDHSFDLATMSMALHQFHPSDRDLILKEIFRVSEVLIILDYSNPLPEGFKKKLVFFIERMAGKEHSGNFREFNTSGGVVPIIEKSNFKCTHSEISGSGIFTLYRIEKSS